MIENISMLLIKPEAIKKELEILKDLEKLDYNVIEEGQLINHEIAIKCLYGKDNSPIKRSKIIINPNPSSDKRNFDFFMKHYLSAFEQKILDKDYFYSKAFILKHKCKCTLTQLVTDVVGEDERISLNMRTSLRCKYGIKSRGKYFDDYGKKYDVPYDMVLNGIHKTQVHNCFDKEQLILQLRYEIYTFFDRGDIYDLQR